MIPEHDSKLSALLGRSDPAGLIEPLPPADFSAAVHRRLDTVSRSVVSVGVLHRLGFAREVLPFAAAIALVGGLVGGGLAYADKRAHTTALHVAAYARSIDPWLMHAPATTGDR